MSALLRFTPTAVVGTSSTTAEGRTLSPVHPRGREDEAKQMTYVPGSTGSSHGRGD